MKRAPLIFTILSLLILGGCAGTQRSAEYIEAYHHYDLDETELVAENEYLSLNFDCNTTGISLTDKRTGKVWYSNPPDAASDGIAISAMLDRLQSQVIVNYGQTNGIVTEVNNLTLSVKNGAYDWEAVENGVKVRYTIGKTEQVFMVPPVLYESRYMEYFNQMEETEQKSLSNYYRIIDLNNLRATDNREELLQLYPGLAEERVFALREGLQKNIMQRLEEYFEGIGYTAEDYMEDQEAVGGDDESETPVFNISVIYRLDGPDLVVSVPLDEIQFRSKYPVLSISVLPFFGAGGLDDEGFLLVPDGSGGMINFNNGKHNQAIYNNSLYGYDYALKRSAIIMDNGAYFPVFGISHNGDSFICVVEEGAESTSFTADVSGRVNTYNSANTFYTVTNWDDVDISKANVYAKAFERGELSGEFSQRYIFSGSDDYVSMAALYRDYLTGRYSWLTETDEEGIPFVLSLVGAIDRRENVMGIPVTRAYPLTTYNEAADIIGKFADSGISNMRVNLSGWFNGGVIHDAPANVKLISSLGGKKGFTGLLDRAAEYGAEIFMEADFTYIYNIGAFNGYRVNRDTAKRLSREEVKLYPYSSIWFGERTGTFGKRYTYYLATPKYTMRAIDRFYSKLNELGGDNITFSDIGRSLNSDFDVKKPVSRREAAAMHQEKMAELKENGAKLMIYGGNVYAAVYSDFILNMELESKNFNIIDESVPFYQIALRGIVPYTGSPINLSADYTYAMLKAVETGAGLQFLFINAAGEDLQDTNYTRFFASDLARWGERPGDMYNKINSQLSHTANLLITGHEKLAEKVYRTEYEDGTQVIVNYGSEPFLYEGHSVGAADFTVIRP